MRTRLFLTALLTFAALSWNTAHAAPPSQLKPLDFLLGDWDAIRAKADDASGKTTFSRALQDRVIERKNFADYPGANGKPASRHDDMMLIYATGDAVRADYFDSEGHVIHYAVTSPATNQAVFVSDATPRGPPYRLTCKLRRDWPLQRQFAVPP